MRKVVIFLFMFATISVSAGTWKVYRLEDSLSPKNDITAISFDQKGTLWIATSYGIYKQTDAGWVAQGPENIYVRALFIDGNNIKWAGLTGGGLNRSVDGITWTNIPEASLSQSVNVINSDNKGSIWVGDWNEGLFNQVKQSDGKEQWINYRAADEKVGDKEKIGDNAILSVLPDSKGGMWFGSYHGLSLLKNGKWTFFNTQNSQLPDNNIYSLATDSNENIWIGTGNGLVKFDGSNWTVYSNENSGLSCDLILSLATDVSGHLWVGTNKGVFFFNGIGWTNFTAENSDLPDNRVQSIKVHENKVYLGTSHGLAVYEP
jgi:ligand-binding sensor domain-containing protein